MLRFVVLFAALLVVSLVALPAHAQQSEAVVAQLYGNGVHAYFAGDFAKAHEQLTAAIAGGSRDPRVYYFRGLAYLKLGREPEAKQDFQTGGALESKDLHRFYNVARSLERVQGTVRQQLETYRVDARLAALEEANKIRKARFEAVQREEKRVLRSPAAQTPAEPISAPEGQPAAKTADTDPFGNVPEEPKPPAKSGEEKPAEPTAEKPAAPIAEKPAEPTAEKPAEPTAEKPASSDPFGGGAAAEKPAAESKESPFKEEPAAEKAAAGSKPPKQSILGAFFKGSQEGVKNSLGSVGGLGKMMLPGGKGPGATVPTGIPAAPAANDPFGTGSDEKPAPPTKAEPEKPAATPPAAAPPAAAPPAAAPPAPAPPAPDPFATGPEEKKPAPPPTPAPPKADEKDPFGT